MLCPWDWGLSSVLVYYNLVLLQLKGEEKSFVKIPHDAMQTSLKSFDNICSIAQCIKKKSKVTRYELWALFYMALCHIKRPISLIFQTNPGNVTKDLFPEMFFPGNVRERQKAVEKGTTSSVSTVRKVLIFSKCLKHDLILHTLVHPFRQSKQL